MVSVLLRWVQRTQNHHQILSGADQALMMMAVWYTLCEVHGCCKSIAEWSADMNVRSSEHYRICVSFDAMWRKRAYLLSIYPRRVRATTTTKESERILCSFTVSDKTPLFFPPCYHTRSRYAIPVYGYSLMSLDTKSGHPPKTKINTYYQTKH